MPVSDMLTQHYFIDFVAIILMFISIWLLGNRRREGFVFGILAALAFVAFNGLVLSIPGVIGNFILLWLNARGWCRWEADSPAAT